MVFPDMQLVMFPTKSQVDKFNLDLRISGLFFHTAPLFGNMPSDVMALLHVFTSDEAESARIRNQDVR